MGLNWVEDIVAHLYEINRYMVIRNEDFVMTKTGRHSDLDILAIKDSKIVHIECQTWWGPSKKDERKEFQRLKDRFDNAPKVIFDKYKFLQSENFKIHKVFVTSGKPTKKNKREGPWDRLEAFCKDNKIELVEINTKIRDLVDKLKEDFPKPNRVGKLPPLARFLLHLIHNQFLKIDLGGN